MKPGTILDGVVPHPLTKREIDTQLILHERAVVNRSISRKSSDWKVLPQSPHSKNTVNPVRKTVEACQIQPNPEKRLIKLHLGDPSLGGVLPPPKVAVEALHAAVETHLSDGYGPAVGALRSREAIVKRYSTEQASFTAEDVVLASGCSHALQMAIEAIAGAGDNILVPHPGFPLYSTLCRPHGIEDRAYKIELADGAHIDLRQMAALIDSRTKAIIINNPGNPTGCVFTKDHLEQVLKIANDYRLVMIADEIYGDLVYNGAHFHPLASLSPKVPVITCDGLAKRWMVPGWRLGWLIIYDVHEVLGEVKKGIVALSQKIVGPCSLIQGALPTILEETPQAYFEYTRAVIQANANLVIAALNEVPGLATVKTQGAMYMLVAVDKDIYGDDVTFCQNLIREEAVFCLPGQAFSAPGYFRLVLTSNVEEMEEAMARIRSYCLRHIEDAIGESESSDEGCFLGNPESD